MKLNYVRLLSFSVPLLFLISGCWDVMDIDRRSLIIALGLDAAPGNKVIATAQIPIFEPSLIHFIGQGPQKPFTTISSQDKTAFGATLDFETKTPNSIFWGQLKCVVVNTALAKHGLKSYCQFIERHPEISPKTFMVLTESTSQEILSVDLSTKSLPGMAISDYFDSKSKINSAYPIQLWRFVKMSEIRPTDAYLPILSYNKAEQVYQIGGIGVFHRDRLVGKLSENETRMAGIVMGKPVHASFSVPIGKMGDITYRRVIAKSKIFIQRTRPTIRFLILIESKGFGPSITSNQTELRNKDIKQIERATERYLTKQILNTLGRLQRLNSDIIGFGDQIRANNPEVWKNLNWNQEYAQVSYQVKVKFQLERVGKFR